MLKSFLNAFKFIFTFEGKIYLINHRLGEGCSGQETRSLLVRSETSFGWRTTGLQAPQCGSAQLHCSRSLNFIPRTGARVCGEICIVIFSGFFMFCLEPSAVKFSSLSSPVYTQCLCLIFMSGLTPYPAKVGRPNL